jgi:hypothetical protein
VDVKQVLHLLRAPAPPPAEAVADGDRVVLLDDVAPDKLLDLVLAHDTVIVW